MELNETTMCVLLGAKRRLRQRSAHLIEGRGPLGAPRCAVVLVPCIGHRLAPCRPIPSRLRGKVQAPTAIVRTFREHAEACRALRAHGRERVRRDPPRVVEVLFRFLAKFGFPRLPDVLRACEVGVDEHYGVTRVEDLPFNYRGVLAQEGERLTSQLFKDYAARAAAIQNAQTDTLTALGIISPALAVRRASMTGAATDLGTHLAFLAAAEAYRYDMVQKLNGLQASAVASADDAARSKDPIADRRTRISADFWKTIPDFDFSAPSPAERAGAMVMPLAVLGLWVALAIGLFAFARRRLERAGL